MGGAVNASRSGDLLNDTYELCELVASRDTHQLYSARDTRNDRLVHIALLRPEVALRKGVAQHFVKAPKLLTQLEHPNVARVWSVETDASGIPFVVEEPRAGQSLAAMIETFPDGMPLGVAVNLLVPIVEAMAAAHGSGLWHGAFDAKHVVLSEQGGTTTPKVFGFATKDGTPNPSEDVRAIGALMYRALSGQSANDKRRSPLDELAPHLPLELTELVERCLASADERPADARLLSDELSSLRQRIVGQRASAVSVERAVQRDSPAPAKPAPKVVPNDAARARRVAIERAPTAPIEEEKKIDPHGATCFDAEPPKHEPAPVPAPVQERDRDSFEFPMASLRPDTPATAAKPQVVLIPDQIETKADEPLETREDRGKGKPRKASAKEKQDGAGMSVAGPARLAAAFAPLEGADNVVQGETKEAELGRAFRQAQDEERQAREARFGRVMPMSAAAATGPSAQKPGAGQGQQVKAAPLLAGAKSSGADKKREQARPTAAEVMALSQLHAQDEANKERRSRFIGALLLMLFCFFLARAVPLLNGTRAQVEEVLGAHVKTAAIAFSVLSLVMLIKTWALQIQSKEVLLKPVTYTLKVVVVCATVLCATYLLPRGALGMLEGAARRFLPWSAAAYFMFLGFYGMMRGMREAQANLVAGLVMTLAYGGSFIGSYTIASNVIAPNMRAGRAQTELALQMLEQQKEGGAVDHDALLEGAGLDPEAAAEIAKQAAAEDGFKEAKIMGSSEEDDMKSIREMGDARKRNSERLNELKDKIPELAK
jgi:hypothetical protein